MYQYTKTFVNSDGTTAHGKLVVNLKTHTFTFAGEGFAPGTYSLCYGSGSTRVDLCPDGAVADQYGMVSISARSYDTGVWDLAKFAGAVVTTTQPEEPLEAIIVVTDSYANGDRWEWAYTVKTRGDVASGLVDVYGLWAENAQPTESIPLSQFPSQKTISIANNVPAAVGFGVEGPGGNTASVRVVFRGTEEKPQTLQ